MIYFPRITTSDTLESFSEGTLFQPLFISFEFLNDGVNGRNLYIAAASLTADRRYRSLVVADVLRVIDDDRVDRTRFSRRYIEIGSGLALTIAGYGDVAVWGDLSLSHLEGRRLFVLELAWDLIETNSIVEADRAELFKLIETEIISLHDGNVARFKVRLSEYQAWKMLE